MRNLVKGLVLSTFVASMAFGAGCGKKAATCENAVDHATGLIMGSDEMKKASAEEKKLAEAMVKGMKDEMVKKCKEEKWDSKQLQCVMDAKKMDDMEKCDMDKKGGDEEKK